MLLRKESSFLRIKTSIPTKKSEKQSLTHTKINKIISLRRFSQYLL